MPGAWIIEEPGGADKLKWVNSPKGRVGARHALIRHTAIGINFLDVYQRSGLYPMDLPARLGMEAVGVVEKAGSAVTEVSEGDRVAYAGIAGGYADYNRVLASRLVKIPDNIGDELVAATFLKGLTCGYLLRYAYKLGPGKVALVHAAAGGVGLLLTQWAKYLGAEVIATVGSIAKTHLSYAAGADHVVVTGLEDVVDNVMRYTKKRGVDVVYDSVGKDTAAISLDCLARRGLLVLYGNASGPPPPIDPGALMARGSLYVTRPSLADYIREREDLEELSNELFHMLGNKRLDVSINQRYALSDLPKAHRDLEARRTTGSSVLLCL